MGPMADLPQTDSGIPIKRLYSADDLTGWDPAERLGAPGEAPYTRGVYSSMYTGRLWTMRQYSGFGNAEATNERFKFLLNAGQTGLSCAFDLPTQMGYDSDHGRAEGEVGKVGVAIDSMEDMRLLLADLPLDKVTTSMTINSTAAILLLMYELVAEENGVRRTQIGGTIQNDLLKEYIARGTYIFPPRPSMRIITDIFGYCSPARPELEHDLDLGLPHPRGRLDGGAGDRVHDRQRHRLRAGGDRRRSRRRRLRAAPVVLLERPQQLLRRGRQVPRQPAHVAHDHDGALPRQGPEVGKMLRFHTQTGGSTLTAQQPMNNVVRVNVASVEGFMPVPYQATYAASKAFVLSFTRALAYETMGTGVRVASLAPGAVATAMHAKAGAEYSRYVQLFPVKSAEEIARVGYRKFMRGRKTIVIGLFNRIGLFLRRFTPDFLIVPLMGWFFRVRDADGNLQLPRALAERRTAKPERASDALQTTARPRRLARIARGWRSALRRQVTLVAFHAASSRLLKIQYAAMTAMKNDMRSAMHATSAIMVA